MIVATATKFFPLSFIEIICLPRDKTPMICKAYSLKKNQLFMSGFLCIIFCQYNVKVCFFVSLLLQEEQRVQIHQSDDGKPTHHINQSMTRPNH